MLSSCRAVLQPRRAQATMTLTSASRVFACPCLLPAPSSERGITSRLGGTWANIEPLTRVYSARVNALRMSSAAACSAALPCHSCRMRCLYEGLFSFNPAPQPRASPACTLWTSRLVHQTSKSSRTSQHTANLSATHPASCAHPRSPGAVAPRPDRPCPGSHSSHSSSLRRQRSTR